MDSSFCRIINTTNCNSDSLNSLLGSFFFHLNIVDLNLIYSKTVDSLASPFNERSFLHEELEWLIPKISLVYLYVHSDTLFLKPQLILTLSKATYFDIVDAMLVSFINYKLGFWDLVANIGATGLINFEELKVGRLNRGMLERKSNFLLRKDCERLVVRVVQMTSLWQNPGLLVWANDARWSRGCIELSNVL